LQSSSGLDASSSPDARRAAGLPSPNVVRVNNRESERWYDYEDDDDGTAVVTPRGGRPRSNDVVGPGEPSSPTRPGHRPGRNDEAKRLALAAGGDPNDWYRHDHGQSNGTSDDTAASTRTGKRLSSATKDGGGTGPDDVTPLWFASDGVWYDKNANDAETVGKSTTFSPKYAPRYLIHCYTSSSTLSGPKDLPKPWLHTELEKCRRVQCRHIMRPSA